MRLRHIEIFNAVYTVGSVSGAAKFLNITQPTASKILMHAEDQIGFKLFRRIRGRLVPTDEANMLYEETKRISDQVTDLQKMVRNIAEADKGHIRLASISALGLQHIPRAILGFQEKHPGVHFEFQTRHYDNLLVSIQQQEKDIGVVFNAGNQKGLNNIDLGSGEFVCIYKGDYFSGHPDRIRISDIADLPFVSIEKSGPLGDLLNRMLLESGVSLQTRIIAQTYFVALNLVAMGGGIAIVDEFTAASQGVGKVQYKKFDPPIRFSIQAMHREIHPPSRLVRNFLQFLKKEIQRSRLAD